MKRITFVLALLLCVVQFATAQSIRVTGTVTDDTNLPLPEASVLVKGTNTRTYTNLDGQFTINAGRDAVLVISYQGFKTVEIPINGRTVIPTIQLELDANTITEQIVIGYGTARKKGAITGSVSTVSAKAIKDRPVMNAGDVLQGQIAGVQVYTSSGDPSASVSMRIRGVSSITASTAPLFVLDGTPTSTDILTNINPNDIENIVILKDAASTAIYGSRAANGVVYITTKKGSQSKPTVKVSANYGISNIARNPMRVMTSQEWYAMQEIYDPSLITDAKWQAEKEFRLKNNIGTNWKKWILNQNAPTVGADLSISGRGDKVDYYFSFSANRQEGVEQNSSANRYATRLNLNAQATDWLKIGVNVGLVFQRRRVPNYNTTGNSWYNPLNVANWSLPWASAYEILRDPQTGEFLGYGEELKYFDDLTMYNNKYLNKYRPNKDNTVRINSNLYEQITPLKGLTIRFAQGLEGYDNKYHALMFRTLDSEAFTQNRSIHSFSRFFRMTTSNTIEYKFNIADKHNIILLGGQESIINESSGFDAGKQGGQNPNIWGLQYQPTEYEGYPSESFSKYVYNSLFGRVSYDYAEKYYLDASIRRDGSSLFGFNNRYANFWSVGGMWDIKKENFLKDVNWINRLQLNSSYGTVGNSGISNYLPFSRIASTTSGYEGITPTGLSSAGNPNLTWETIETFNIGFDGRFFNFLDAKVEFYNKMTEDMLLNVPFSYTTGYGSGTNNVGNMRNRGIEGTFKFDFIQKKDLFLSATLNIGYNKDRLVKLFDGRDYFELANTGLRYKVGHSIGEFYAVRFAGIDPANGRELWYDLDGNITGDYSEDYKVYIGKSQYAPWSGGLMLDFIYKNFALQAQFSGVFGKYMTNNDNYFSTNITVATNQANMAAEVLYKTWTTPGQIAKYAHPKYVQGAFLDDRHIQNASFVRLKGVTLSYSLGSKALKPLEGVLTGGRIFVTGRNLLTFTKYTGWDPENMTNVSNGRYPNSKEISVGLELTF